MSVVVIYYSGYGHTKRVAETVAEGAQAELIAIDSNGEIQESDWQKLNEAKAIIFGAPTYMGGVPWQFKKFADATSKAWFVRSWQDKVFAGFSNSASLNGDKQVSLQYLQTLASQHGGIWVSLACRHQTRSLQRVRISTTSVALSGCWYSLRQMRMRARLPAAICKPQ